MSSARRKGLSSITRPTAADHGAARALAAVAAATALAVVAGCGGAQDGRVAAPADIPTDLLTRSPEALRAVLVRDGVTYMFVRSATPQEEGADALALPDCWTGGDGAESCARTAPVPAGAVLPALPATLTLLGERGACTAQVGAPVLVNTSGCEASAMVAAPLTGCPLAVAPVGRIDGGFDPELRWRAAPDVAAVPLFADPARLPDPLHRQLVTGWLAEGELKAGTPREGLTARVRVDAGAEALERVVAGFLVGDAESECDWTTGQRAQVGLRRGAALTPLAVPAEWDGALIWRGRVVGVASGLPRDVTVHAVGPDGATAVAFEASVWWDNEECTQGGWAYVEYPCGP